MLCFYLLYKTFFLVGLIVGFQDITCIKCMRHDDDNDDAVAVVKTCCTDGHTQGDCRIVKNHINVLMPKGLQSNKM